MVLNKKYIWPVCIMWFIIHILRSDNCSPIQWYDCHLWPSPLACYKPSKRRSWQGNLQVISATFHPKELLGSRVSAGPWQADNCLPGCTHARIYLPAFLCSCHPAFGLPVFMPSSLRPSCTQAMPSIPGFPILALQSTSAFLCSHHSLPHSYASLLVSHLRKGLSWLGLPVSSWLPHWLRLLEALTWRSVVVI